MNGLICIVSVFNARHQSGLLMGKLFEFKSKALKLRILYKCHKYDCVILPYTLKISKKVSHAFHEKAPFPSESHAKQDVVQSSRPFHVLIRSCPFRVGIEFLKLSPMRIIGPDHIRGSERAQILETSVSSVYVYQLARVTVMGAATCCALDRGEGH